MTTLSRAAKSIAATRRGNFRQLRFTERGRELVLDRIYERNGVALHRVWGRWWTPGPTSGWSIKALAAGYHLAPVRKPLRPPGATYELPILIAHR